jgi:hypothetical protein
MTEDEAKTKWCPQTLGRQPGNPECCMGSACMAWLSEGSGKGEEIERVSAVNTVKPGEGWRWERSPGGVAEWVRRAPGPLLGSCGLAQGVVYT